MALDYRKCAEEIFSHLGGRENVISAAHCATRLRLVIADNSKVDVAALEDTEGVKGVFNSNGQLQLIIGTGTVNKVYDEFLAITGMTAATKEEVKAAAAAKQPLPQRMVKTLGDVFVPILPAIVAAGLMMGLVQALGKVIPSFAGSDWYGFLDMVSSTAFSYLPVLVAISTARVFGGNLFLGGVVGLAMINSSLINAWSVAGMESVPTWQLLFFQVPQVGYQGHVIPVIIAVWLMCWIEKRLHKIVPEIIDLFVTPLAALCCLFPDAVLSIYTDMAGLRAASVQSLWVLCASYVLSVPAFIYFQSVSGTGNTRSALALELSALALYTAYITYVILIRRMDVAVCWTAEFVYSAAILLFSYLYLRHGHWQGKRI